MDLLFIDTETGGLDPKTGCVIDWAVVRTTDACEVRERWTSRILPICGVDVDAARVNGYTKGEWERDAIPFSTASALMKRAIIEPYASEKYVCVAHNAPFDRAFLVNAHHIAALPDPYDGRSWIDTKSLSWPFAAFGQVPNTKLETLASYFGVQNPAQHTAAGDAETLMRIYRSMMKRYRLLVEGEAKVREAGSGLLNSVMDLFGN